MRRLLILVGVMVMGSLISSSAIASLSGGISLSYFSPSYGKINEDLESTNEDLGTNLKLGSGLGLGLGLNYDVTPNWTVRGEYFRFGSKTSDSYSDSGESYDYGCYDYWYDDYYDYYEYWEESGDLEIESKLSALILSGIYRFSPDESFSPYVGAGIGRFSTELNWKSKGYSYYSYSYDYYSYDYLDEEYSYRVPVDYSDSDSTSSIGFQFLGGAEYKIGERFSISGELRYISAKAEGLFKTEDYEGTDVSWSGIFVGLMASYKF